ncbi:MAG: hypothetical protein K2J82_06205 [Muribaculaceae bacterium]|nr:hypothetical protein [Muribaculaceae bacterium]MDE6754185.1 hypothetical protein [Muribaculaceae bacterium]
MKLTLSLRTKLFALLIIAGFANIMACGPFYPIIPTPRFFSLGDSYKTMADFDKEENLKLWQQLSSQEIPVSDIEQAVYKDSRDSFLTKSDSLNAANSDNLFYKFLSKSENKDIREFLSAAKELEMIRTDTSSPWYYPAERNSTSLPADFREVMDVFSAYKGKRLKDRYDLQAVRTLFASGKYQECIDFYETAFSSVADSDLMKRMAKRYAAGCWNRLGNKQRADSMFASAGDIWSISAKNPAVYMSRLNPDAPQLMEYIRKHANDSAFMAEIMPVAEKLLRNNKVKNKGDWELLLAFGNYSQKHDRAKARQYINKAADHSFSSPELHDLARVFRMKCDAVYGDSCSLLSDLKWLEEKDPESGEWQRMTQNIIYEHWVPTLWKRKDFAKAILLCAFADKLPQTNGEEEASDYSNYSFQLMGSLSSGQLISAYRNIIRSNPLNNYLRTKARSDRDYYYELIGTLALREENYERAGNYLSMVSNDYLQSLNISKDGYLSRDPFKVYPSRWSSYGSKDEDDYFWERECQAGVHRKRSAPDAKLKFASQMLDYKREMTKGKSADKRGIARLMYAIGRFNSFEECWALTQYWRGNILNRFQPILQYWDLGDKDKEKEYAFMFDYDKTIGHRQTEAVFDKEVAKAMKMLASDEARAEAQYLLGNLKTVIRKYGDTATASHIKSSCDNWNTWL